jgi:hypothetical protein
MSWKLEKNPTATKKYRITSPEGKSVVFGQRGAQDYTTHKDKARMERYLARHRKRENWTYSGRYTAGFWSRHLLWAQPSLAQAKAYIRKKFNIRVQ